MVGYGYCVQDRRDQELTSRRIIGGDSELVCDWVAARVGAEWSVGKGQGIGLARGEDLIAGVVFDSFNGASVCMHVAAEPGAKWMTKSYLYLCFAYPFKQLKVKKILGLVGSDNLQAQKFDEHLGFVLEATLKEAHPKGDLLVYSMTADQCPWLNLKVSSWEVLSASQSLLKPLITRP